MIGVFIKLQLLSFSKVKALKYFQFIGNSQFAKDEPWKMKKYFLHWYFFFKCEILCCNV